jgi:hypothetical protein
MSAGNTQGVQVEVISNGCRLQLHADVANGLSVICQIHRGDRSAIATVRVSGGLDDLSESVPFRRA